jgi:SAM-dependent methyltransferase
MVGANHKELRDQVRRYFDDNTSVWERIGQGGIAIHRAVWGDGVTTRAEAFAWLDRQIAARVTTLGVAAPRLLDLGCGVGASLMQLAALLPAATAVGVTLSPRQAARAHALIAGAGLAARLRCVEADYLALPDELGSFDAAYAIESFENSPDAAGFFAQAARRLRPGGRLILCDDFAARAPRGQRETQWLERMRTGWMIHNLVTVAEAQALARPHGLELVEDVDLTAHLELRRPRDRLLAAVLALGRPLGLRHTLWRSWLGGDALQRALLARLVEFRFVVLARR